MNIETLTLSSDGMARFIADELRGGYTKSTVIRELFQNADDAGANRLVIGYYPGVPTHANGFLRRPGLVFMNDGAVQPEDIEFLKQVKANRRVSDPYTIGRFGVGKLAVFNWADAYYLHVEAPDLDCESLITVHRDIWKDAGDPSALGAPIRALREHSKWDPDKCCLTLWLPLRMEKDPRTIVQFNPDESPNSSWIKDEKTWTPYVRMLPMLRNLQDLTITTFDSAAKPGKSLHFHLEGKRRDSQLLDRAPGTRSFSGLIRSSTGQAWNYWGVEQRLLDSFTYLHAGSQTNLQDLTRSPKWPRCPESHAPEPKIPHGAVVVVLPEGGASGSPEVTRAAFLPLETRSTGTQAGQVILHANGFLNEQRTHFLGLDGNTEQEIPTRWNLGLLLGATLPLVPEVLEKAIGNLGDKALSWVNKLAENDLIANHPSAVGSRAFLARVLTWGPDQAPGWQWRAIRKSERVLVLNLETADRLQQYLRPMVEKGLVVRDGNSPCLGLGEGNPAFTEADYSELGRIARAISRPGADLLDRQAYLDLLRSIQAQISNSEAMKLPIPIQSAKPSVRTLREVRELHVSKVLWRSGSTDLFQCLQKGLAKTDMVHEIDHALGVDLGLGLEPSPEQIAIVLGEALPALNASFTARIPLTEALSGLLHSDAYRRGLRYLLHGSLTNVLEDEQDLLADSDLLLRSTQNGIIQDLMNRLADESPAWTRLPSEVVDCFSKSARAWLGIRVHDPSDAISWALDHPERITPPPYASDPDAWRAEALSLFATHLVDPMNEVARSTWGRFPLHSLGQTERGPIAIERTFRHVKNCPDWVPDEIQLFHPYATSNPYYKQFSEAWDSWSHWRLIDWTLSSPTPHQFAKQLLDYFNGTGGYDKLPSDVKEKLHSRPWIQVVSSMPVPATDLRSIVPLPGQRGAIWRNHLEAGSGIVDHHNSRWFSEDVVAESVRTHQAWTQHISPLLHEDPSSRVYKIGKLVANCKGDFNLGCKDLIRTQEEFEFILSNQHFAQDEDAAPHLALALLHALKQDGLALKDVQNLLDQISTAPISADGYRFLLHRVGERAGQGASSGGDDLGYDLFRNYLNALTAPPTPGDFKGLFLPGRKGIWKSAGHFANPDLLDDEHDVSHIFEDRWHEALLEKDYEWPILDVISETPTEVDLVSYFEPWEREGVPRACIACFLSVLGGTHRQAALHFLTNHNLGENAGIRHIRGRLPIDGDLVRSMAPPSYESEDHQRDAVFDRHMATVRAASKNKKRAFAALDGQRLELTHFEGTLIQQVVPQVSVRYVRRSRTPIHERHLQVVLSPELSFQEIREIGAGALKRLLKDGARDILLKAYCEENRHIDARFWDELWEDTLSHQEQMHLHSVQSVIKQTLHHTVKTLLRFMDPELPGRHRLKDLSEECHSRNLDYAAAAESKDHSQARKDKEKSRLDAAQDAFVQALEEPSTQQALLSGVRGLIRKRQYSPDRILFELYQNAEDAYLDLETLGRQVTDSESSLGFTLVEEADDRSLNILHRGRPICYYQTATKKVESFRNDLENMLGFNMSSKEGTSVGEHGLGFKSVHLVTDSPTVLSDRLSFKIDGGIYPTVFEPESFHGALAERAGQVSTNQETLIHLPFPASFQCRASELIDSFWTQGYPLLAFSRQIRSLHRLSANGRTQQIRWTPRSLWNNGALSVEWMPTEGKAFYLRIGDSQHALLLFFNAEGELELPKDAATLWALAPTKKAWGQGFKVRIQAPFSLDQGRTQLGDAEAEKNKGHFIKVGKITRLALEGLLQMESLFRALPIDRDQFLTQLWEGFASPLGRLAMGTGDDQAPYQQALLQGVGAFWADGAWGPDGFDGFIAANQVQTYLRGEQWRIPAFRGAMQELFPNCLENAVHEPTWVNGLRNFADREAKPPQRQDIGLLQELLVGVLSPSATTSLTKVLQALPEEEQPNFLHHLKHGATPFVQSENLEFKSLHQVAFSSDEEGLLSALAPESNRIHPDYSSSAKQLLLDLRKDLTEPLIRAWLLETWSRPGGRSIAKQYLQKGRFSNSILNKLQYDPTAPHELKEMAQKRAQVIDQVPEEFPDEDEGILGAEAIRRIYLWWEELPKKEQKSFRDQFSSGIERTDLNDSDPIAQRIAWMKLFVFGAGHSLGIYQPSRLRAFIHHHISPSLWSTLVAHPPSSEAPESNHLWMNLLNDRMTEEADQRGDYDHLLRSLFGALHRIGFGLQDYIELFRQQDRRKAPFDIMHLATPDTDPQLRGMALGHIPSLRRIMGSGLNVVLRELKRTGVLTSPFIDPHTFSPSARVRELLRELNPEEASDWDLQDADPGKSVTIHRIVLSSLQEEDLQLPADCFDFPLLALAEDRELLQEILGIDLPVG
jgi:hypothetical protein